MFIPVKLWLGIWDLILIIKKKKILSITSIVSAVLFYSLSLGILVDMRYAIWLHT